MNKIVNLVWQIIESHEKHRSEVCHVYSLSCCLCKLASTQILCSFNMCSELSKLRRIKLHKNLKETALSPLAN